jgi:hypothetical protein
MAMELFGGMGEIEFLHAYEDMTLRKPQVVSDNVLTGIHLSDASHRIVLSVLLMQEAVESARRLAAVWAALSDRSRTVAQRLAGPLPGAEVWHAFVDEAMAAPGPAHLLRAMAIDSSAGESARELLEFEGLAQFEPLVRVFELGPPVALVPSEAPPMLLLGSTDAAGQRIEAYWSLERDDVTALGDATGYFVTWARDFLGAYIDARHPPS